MERSNWQSDITSIKAYLSRLCSGNFAFWLEGQIVYYAKEHWTGATKWPCEAILIQGLMGQKKNLFQKTIGCVYSPNTQPSIMGKGMAAHYQLTLRLEERPSPQISVGQLRTFQFIEFTASDVMVQQTDWCGTFDLGSPQVNLKNQGAYLHRLYLMAALRIIYLCTPKIVHLSEYSRISRDQGHNIAALLVSQTGEVLAYGLNTALVNNTYHAEVNMLQAYAKSGQAFPQNAYIYTTMKPCDMCAAMITQLLPDSTVIYAQDDPKALGTTAPSGGMSLLSNVPGAKQIKLTKGDFTKQGNLIDELATRTQNKQANTTTQHPMYYLTKVVDTNDIFSAMTDGQRGLQSKAQKYNNSQTWDYYGTSWVGKHPEVPKVLVHLSQFLNFQLNEPQLNYERIDEDFPDAFQEPEDQ